MARRRRKKRNPTPLETGLLTIGAAVIGGVGGFYLASKACGKLFSQALEKGVIEPGPNYGTVEAAVGPAPGNGG